MAAVVAVARLYLPNLGYLYRARRPEWRKLSHFASSYRPYLSIGRLVATAYECVSIVASVRYTAVAAPLPGPFERCGRARFSSNLAAIRVNGAALRPNNAVNWPNG